MIAIEMAGGVYCPLSPRDPQHRLQLLVEQTQSRIVLVHHLTKSSFKMNITSNDIDSILICNNIQNEVNVDLLTTVPVELDDIGYIIFTSGSTGIPKAVSNETNTIY